MADTGVDQRLNKELNFSVSEEDFENGGQMTAHGTGEAQSPASERDEDEEMKDPKSPPRDEHYPSQNSDTESPDPVLWAPVSALPKCPEMPRAPRKIKLPVANNLSPPQIH
ncbi:Wee1-like protein kinase 2 [Lemmus lemmus]